MFKEDLDALAETYRQGLTEEAYLWLRNRGLTDATIGKSRLGCVVSGRFQGAISIPYFDARGLCSTIRFRYVDTSIRPNKYDSLTGLGAHLYGVKNVDENEVWLCEGEFDSLILGQMGFPAIGIAGTSSFKPQWKWLFSNCDAITLVMDGDAAGRKAAARLTSILGTVDADIRLVDLPEGQDVTDMFLENENELRALVQ